MPGDMIMNGILVPEWHLRLSHVDLPRPSGVQNALAVQGLFCPMIPHTITQLQQSLVNL